MPRAILAVRDSAWRLWFPVVAGATAVTAGYVLPHEPRLLPFVAAVAVAALVVLLLDVWQALFVATLLALIIALTDFPMPFFARFLLAGALLAATVHRHPPKRPAGRQQAYFAGLLGAFMVFSVASLVWTEQRLLVAQQLAAAVAIVGVVLIAGQGRWRQLENLKGDLLLMYVVVGGFSVLSIAVGVLSNEAGRLSGLYANPNALGMITAVSIGLGVGIHAMLPRWRRVVLVTQVVLLIGVVLTASRTAIAAALGALLYPIGRDLGVRSRARQLLPWLVGGAVVAALLGLSLPARFQDPLLRVWTSVITPEQALDSGRDAIWERAIDNWQIYPFVGHGFRSGRDASHSGVLQLLRESGLIGFALVMLALLAVLVPKGPMDDRIARSVWISGTSAVAAGLVVQIGESSLFGFGQPFPLVFWAAASMAVVAARRTRPVDLPSGVTRVSR
jgi:exopolysaccharide production protein ExoQ